LAAAAACAILAAGFVGCEDEEEDEGKDEDEEDEESDKGMSTASAIFEHSCFDLPVCVHEATASALQNF
jgi:hypothetical protein